MMALSKQQDLAIACEQLRAERDAALAEIERYKNQWADWSSSLDSVMKQRNDLQAKLAAMGNTEPVAWMDEYGNPFTLSAHKGKWYGHGERNWKPLYTAPKVAPEQVEAAWRAGWAACRDAEYVGQEAEDETWGMSETCANADWESAAPKVAQPLSTERFKAITNSLSRQQGWDGDGWDLALKEAIEAAHEIGGQQP